MPKAPPTTPLHVRLDDEQLRRLRDCKTATRAISRTDVTLAAVLRRALDLGLAKLEADLHIAPAA